MKLPGVPDGGYGHLGAVAGAGGHLGGMHSIRSSSGGPDEAIDTPSIVLPVLEAKIGLGHFAFLI